MAFLSSSTYLPQIYKGRVQNGAQVAIRCLTISKKYTIRNLKLRLDLLAKLRHPHLVCLLGHCIANNDNNGDPDSLQVYLVYEYVASGNYRSHLSGKCREHSQIVDTELTASTDYHMKCILTCIFLVALTLYL